MVKIICFHEGKVFFGESSLGLIKPLPKFIKVLIILSVMRPTVKQTTAIRCLSTVPPLVRRNHIAIASNGDNKSNARSSSV
jgi:hypothetical protein